MNSQLTKILLALDPSDSEFRPTRRSLSWFKKWAGDRKARVEAIYVSFGHSNVKPVTTEHEFTDFVKSLDLGPDVVSSILIEKSSSRRAAALRLAGFAKGEKADLIAVSSHGRSGPARLVLGSFAESLLAVSQVPLLFLTEHEDQRPHANKVLFPTDFSPASKVALDLFLKEMAGTTCEVVIFHAESPPGAIFSTGIIGIPYYLPESYWLEQKQWTGNEAEKLVKSVQERGFKVKSLIQDGVLNTAASIQKAAQDENVDFIAMSSVSRGFDSAVIGSVAKEIFRLKRWPVWVCGPEVSLKNGLS